MTLEQHQMNTLLKHFIQRTMPPADFRVVDWQLLIRLMAEYRLDVVMYPLLTELPADQRPCQDLLDALQQKVLLEVGVQCQTIHAVKEIMGKFQDCGIPVIMAKGLSIARYYPNPDYRFMNDLDVLINEVDLKRAKALLKSEGFVIDAVSAKHECYEKEQGLMIEVHTALYESGINKPMLIEGWQEQVWQRTTMMDYDQMVFRVMSIEDILIHELLHFAMHFSHSGASIRHLVDLGMILQLEGASLDWPYIQGMVQEIGMARYVATVFNVLKESFGVIMPLDDLGDVLIEASEVMHLVYLGFPADQDHEKDRLMRRLNYRHPWIVKAPILKGGIWLAEVLVNVAYHRQWPKMAIREANEQLPRYDHCIRVLTDIGLM